MCVYIYIYIYIDICATKSGQRMPPGQCVVPGPGPGAPGREPRLHDTI